MKKPTEWQVGQEVYLRDVNEKRFRGEGVEPPKVKIVKIGRTLVHIQEYNRTRVYGKDDGRARDAYGHSWIETIEDYEDSKACKIQRDRITALKIEFRGGDLSSKDLTRIADLLESIVKD